MQPNSVRILSLNLHLQLRTHLFFPISYGANFVKKPQVIFTKMYLLGIKWILKFAKTAVVDGRYIALWF